MYLHRLTNWLPCSRHECFAHVRGYCMALGERADDKEGQCLFEKDPAACDPTTKKLIKREAGRLKN